MAIGVSAALPAIVPERGLLGEAGLLVRALRTRVLGTHFEPDPLETQLGESEVDERANGIGPVALAPLVGLADEDADLRAAIDPVEIGEHHLPDRTFVVSQANHERVHVFSLVVGDSRDPLLDLGETEWCAFVPSGERHRLCVGAPSSVRLGIRRLERSEEDPAVGDDVGHRLNAGRATRGRRAARTCPRWRSMAR